jgi:hypothetical protein
MRKIFTFTAATLLMASAFGAGEVYRWKGQDGTWHYSDQPREGAELIRTGVPTPPADGDAQPTVGPAEPELPPDDVVVPTNEPMPVSDAVAAEVRAAAAAAQSARCTKAEAAYKSAIENRRIYRTDAQGNRVFLTSAEIDAARLQARANRDEACGPGA